MKRISKYIVALIFASLMIGFVSCVKDNGNYEYTELPALDIADCQLKINGNDSKMSDDNTIYVLKGDRLVVSPKYDIDKTLSPKYKWTLIVNPNDSKNPKPGEVIGEEAELDYTFTQIPSKFYIILEVKNAQEGLEYKKIMTFNVVIQSLYGVVIVHRDAVTKDGDITMFNTSQLDAEVPETDVVVYSNIYSSFNGGNKLKNPKNFVINYFSSEKAYNICVNDGIVNLDVEYKYNSTELETLFLPQFTPTKPFEFDFMASQEVKDIGGFSFFIAGGKYYARFIKPNPYGYGDNLIGSFNNDTYFPHVAMNYDGPREHLIFNKSTTAFEFLREGYGGVMWGMDMTLPPLQIASVGEVPINKTNMDVIAFGRASSKFIAIMKDNASAIHALVYELPTSGNSPKADMLSKNTITSLPKMNANCVWEFGSRGDYAFYGSGNELYTYNATTNAASNSGVIIPEGETITKLKLFRDATNTSHNGSILFVATKDVNGAGKVYQLQFNPLAGRIDASTAKVVDGLGEVVDINYVKK